MKTIQCPKCDHSVEYNQKQYNIGRSLVFECEKCRKLFTIINGENDCEEVETNLGHIVVLENGFGLKQVFNLKKGDNIIGRYNKGCEVTHAIVSHDRSMDRRHCIINVKEDACGDIIYTLRDNSSITGTFVMNSILSPKERRRIEDGTIISIGATTFILHAAKME